MEKCCPELAGKIDLDEEGLTKKDKRYGYRKICLEYWKTIS